jgi:hypothetical protein
MQSTGWCNSFFTCSGFAIFALFYSSSAYYIPPPLRRYCIPAVYLLQILVTSGIELLTTWGFLTAGLAITWILSPSSLEKIYLPIELTNYRVVNAALFFLPLASVWFLTFNDETTALASLLLLSLLIPIPWTIYLAIKSCSTNTETELPLLRFFWMLGGIFLLLVLLLAIALNISGQNTH